MVCAQGCYLIGQALTGHTDKIEEERQRFIRRLFESLHNLVDKIRTGKHNAYQCSKSFECDSILLGALIKEMDAQQLSPRPLAPFLGLSIADTVEKISNIRSSQWCANYSRRCQSHACSLQSVIQSNSIIDSYSSVKRLELDDFCSPEDGMEKLKGQKESDQW